jgi:effector-binding domain-containing protein
MNQNISAEEVHGMLTLRKAQIEQSLQEQIEQIRSIETRIWEIETEGVLSDDDVLLKHIPQQRFLSTRQVFNTVEQGFFLMTEIHRLLPDRTNNQVTGQFAVLFHSEGFDTRNLDVEMGILLEQDFFETLTLSENCVLKQRTVPAVATMATLARVGIYNDSVGHYGALGHWIERHNYEIVGPGWEVLLEPFQPGKEDEAVVEIRIPVHKST